MGFLKLLGWGKGKKASSKVEFVKSYCITDFYINLHSFAVYLKCSLTGYHRGVSVPYPLLRLIDLLKSELPDSCGAESPCAAFITS